MEAQRHHSSDKQKKEESDSEEKESWRQPGSLLTPRHARPALTAGAL